MDLFDNFGVLYFEYSKYVNDCEKKGVSPKSYFKYIISLFKA